MTLSKELIEEFRALHFAKFGEEIDYAKAELDLQGLADLVRITTPTKENGKCQKSTTLMPQYTNRSARDLE